MLIQHLRNATLLLTTATHKILVDPALGPKGSLPPFSFIRSKARRNPIVGLPSKTAEALQGVTHCLITHRHPDHLDQAGIDFLTQHNIPVYCSKHDEKALRKSGLTIAETLSYHEPIPFLEGTLEGIPARHGYGWVARLMGNVMGFYLKLPEEPTVYLSSDTIYTEEVHHVLTAQQPDIAVLAAGAAQLDVLKPLLMHEADVAKFVQNAPAQVVVNHLEAVNHCTLNRASIRQLLSDKGLMTKAWIPEDGEQRTYPPRQKEV